MFTWGTIWVLTHGHVGCPDAFSRASSICLRICLFSLVGFNVLVLSMEFITSGNIVTFSSGLKQMEGLELRTAWS